MLATFLPALKAHLVSALAPLHLIRPKDKNTEATLSAPQVFIGDLPSKQADREDFPCVLLVQVGGGQGEGETQLTVGLICCVYNAEEGDREGAEMDMALLISAVTQALMPCAASPLNRRYRLVPDPRGQDTFLPWKKSDEQPRPYMQATIVSHWRMKGFE